ncbi:MAG: cyclic pyranopterin monophosphate synthase MoaC [Chloroflexi bacterium]|nr:cyclic pyranopterin monophosphate synthase MoaC [Chloroflexota bacterium]
MDEGRPKGLTHLDGEGRVRMVDVGAKPETERLAVARGRVVMLPQTLARITEGGVPKGDALAAAQIAGILAAKRTADLIPLCHPLLLNQVGVDFHPVGTPAGEAGLEITASVRTTGRTGAEMEALTAVSVAALTIYDMCKAVDKAMRITDIRLVRKSGGQSGEIVVE